MIKTQADFLRAFSHSLYTVGFIQSTKNNKKIVRTFPVKPDLLENQLDELKNNFGTGIDLYFTPNETNGVLNSEGTACHADKNVTLLQSLFLDVDTHEEKSIDQHLSPCDQQASTQVNHIKNVQKFSSEEGLKPHLVVNTSPNNYHLYWLLEPTPVTPESVQMWQQLQIFLHQSFSSDQSAKNLGRLMRIPFSNNVKRNCKVKLAYQNLDIPRYTLTDIYNKLNHKFNVSKIAVKEKLKPLETVKDIPSGQRHEALIRYGRKLFELDGMTADLALDNLTGFAVNRFKDYKEFVNGGHRSNEIIKIVKDLEEYKKKEAVKLIHTKIVEIGKKVKDPFELDPEFFYNAPGLVGDLTRYIVDSSSWPIPSHAFAAATNLVGITKCRHINGYDKLPPVDYFLCLSPSGSGKSTIKGILMDIANKLKIRKFIQPGIASAQGIGAHLNDNPEGIGLVLYDEVKDLFQTIQSRKAATYETRILTELTSLYSSYKSDYELPRTKTQKGKSPIIKAPIFAFIGYGHFDLLESLISKQYITSGFIPRFLIFNVVEDSPRKSFVYGKAKLPSHILDRLEQLVRRSKIGLEESVKQESKEAAEEILEAKIEALESEPLIKTELSIDDSAEHKAFRIKMNELAKQSVEDRNGLEAIFKRGAEHAHRLALAIEDNAVITDSTLAFCHELAEKQVNSFYTKFDKILNTSKLSKDINKLEDKIAELLIRYNGRLLKRDLQRLTKNWYDRPDDFHKQIKFLEEVGTIEIGADSKQKLIRWTKEI